MIKEKRMKYLKTYPSLLVLLISLFAMPQVALAQLEAVTANPLLVSGVIHSINVDLGEIVVDGKPYTFDPTKVSLIDTNNIAITPAELKANLSVVITLTDPSSTVITVIQLQRNLFIPSEESVVADQSLTIEQ